MINKSSIINEIAALKVQIDALTGKMQEKINDLLLLKRKMPVIYCKFPKFQETHDKNNRDQAFQRLRKNAYVH